MSDQDSNIEDTGDEYRDRRSNSDLRLIFNKACEITAPFFDGSQDRDSSSLTRHVCIALREAYPELTQQEVEILYAGVARHHEQASKKTD